jgi:ribosomal subunit interface protein
VDIVVRGRHLAISDRYREHATGKVSRIERFTLPIDHVDVEISHEPNPRQSDRAFEVEITCRGSGPVIRAEAHAPDKYSALDLALARLDKQVRRMVDRRGSRRTARVTVVPASELLPLPDAPGTAGEQREPEEDDKTVFAEGPIVVRLKEHEGEPMTVAQAVESMELVGHDFYLFRDRDTGAPSVLYHRRGYNYGLLRLEGGHG